MTVTIPFPLLVLSGLSLLLFLGVTAACKREFKGRGGDLEAVLAVVAYLVFWLLPSLLAWAAWATWLAVQ